MHLLKKHLNHGCIWKSIWGISMKKKNSLIQNTIWLYMMNVAKLIFPLLTLPYLTRVLSTDTYGLVTYAKALNSYVQLVLDFGFLLSATKNIVFADGDSEKIGRIIGDTLVEKCILGFCAAIVYIVALNFIPVMKTHFWFGMLNLGSVLITVFLFDFLFRGIEKMHLIAIPFVIAKSISTCLTFVFIHGNSDLMIIPLLDLISNTIAVLISFYFVKKEKVSLQVSKYNKWFLDLRESSVYFMSNFATTIFGALTTLIAGIYLPMTSIAYWGLCIQFLSAAKALYNPITNSIYPHMIKEKDFKLVKKISILMLVPMLIGSGIVLFGSNILMYVIGGEKYVEAGVTLKLLLPAFIFSFYSILFGWPVLGAIGKEKETTITTILASVVQIIGLIILAIASKFSLNNLAIVTSVSETFLFVARYATFKSQKFIM